MALAAVFGTFLSTAGVLDTEQAPTPARLGYWILISLLGAVTLQGADHGLAAWRPALTTTWRRGLGLMILVLPLTTVAVFGCKLLFGGQPSGAGFLMLLPGMACILAALQLALTLFTRPPAVAVLPPLSPHSTATLEAAMPVPSLPLPLPLRGAYIEALQAEDHYVRVHTDRGSALLRMRFRDALAAVAGQDGIRPHRSWWVATDAATALDRSRGRTVLTLRNGLRIPVSRGQRAALGPRFRA